MKKNLTYLHVFISLFISYTVISQEILQLEIAPYLVPWDDSETDDCLQLLDIDGSSLKLLPLDGIKGFTAEQGFEYTLDVLPNPILEEDQRSSYTLKKEDYSLILQQTTN